MYFWILQIKSSTYWCINVHILHTSTQNVLNIHIQFILEVFSPSYTAVLTWQCGTPYLEKPLMFHKILQFAQHKISGFLDFPLLFGNVTCLNIVTFGSQLLSVKMSILTGHFSVQKIVKCAIRKRKTHCMTERSPLVLLIHTCLALWYFQIFNLSWNYVVSICL